MVEFNRQSISLNSIDNIDVQLARFMKVKEVVETCPLAFVFTVCTCVLNYEELIYTNQSIRLSSVVLAYGRFNSIKYSIIWKEEVSIIYQSMSSQCEETVRAV